MKYTLKPHQERALTNINQSFNTQDKLQYISACGTGKTLVGYTYIDKLLQETTNQTVVLFFPSLALISQTYEAYKDYGLEISKYDILFVCSDESVYEEEILEIDKSEVSFNVTTQEALISDFLTSKVPGTSKNKIIFCTYHSSKILANSFLDAKAQASFALYDEAHKTASMNDSYYNYTLEDTNLKIGKRLFMTATPKHKSVSRSSDEENEEYIYSMTNEARYGEVVEKYTVREAINDKVIAPYKIIVSIVSDEEIELIRAKNTSIVLKNMDLKKAAKIIALSKASEKYNIKKGLVFTERIDRSKEYSLAYDELNNGFNVHLDSTNSTQQINDTFKHFVTASKGMIFNAKLLSEGIDVPSVDLVAFMEKTESSINIAQRIGRATRLDKNNPNKIGYIFIPIFLSSEDEDIFTASQKSGNFSEMLEIINVMAEQDEVLNSIFNKARSNPKEAQKALSDLIVIDDYSNRFDIGKREYLQDKISAYALDSIGSFWDKKLEVLKEYYSEFEKFPSSLEKYFDFNLGTWLHLQKKNFNINKISKERIKLLDDIDVSWKDNVLETRWNNNYQSLKEYYEEFEMLPTSRITYKDLKIGSWLSNNKEDFRINKISKERIKLLDDIDVSWKDDMLELAWKKHYDTTFYYYKEFGKYPSSKTIYKDLKIGSWLHLQKKNFNINKISKERIKLLDDIDVSWKDNVLETRWKMKYELVKEYYEEFGIIPIDSIIYNKIRIGLWLANQRKHHRLNKISKERIKLLDDIDVSWKITPPPKQGTSWKSHYAILKIYYEEFKSFPLPKTIYKEVLLGVWFFNQRNIYEKNGISKERINLLDAIDVSWRCNIILNNSD